MEQQQAKLIKLSDWSAYFPDGVSIVQYRRIGRLINKHGTEVRIEVIPGSHYSLEKALIKLERRKL